MFAKITLYSSDPAETASLVTPTATINVADSGPGELASWQLMAQNLTNGKLTQLLLCLDELGFSDTETVITQE